MNDDLKELLGLLKSRDVEFLVIGAHAVAFHSRPRFTEDLDLWVGRSRENTRRLGQALSDFGAPIGDDGESRFADRDRQMVRLGAPPNMVDILNFAGEHPFEEVWHRSEAGTLLDVDVRFPSADDLIEMKRSAHRAQDLADIESITLSGVKHRKT